MLKFRSASQGILILAFIDGNMMFGRLSVLAKMSFII